MTDTGTSIRDTSDPETGDLVLTLLVEGRPEATARVSAEVAAEMANQLGLARSAIEQELRGALERMHSNSLEKVTIDRVREAAPGSGRFVASYVYRDFRDVGAGAVWYDVPRGETGPDTVPTLVRNKLRYVVHALLVGGDPRVQELRKAIG